SKVTQVGHQAQVLGTREQVVDSGKLAGDSDGRPDPGRLGSHVVSGHLDVSGIGGNQGGQDAHDRGLAGAVGTEQGEDRALRDGEVNPVKHAVLAKRLADSGGDDRGRHRCSSVRVGSSGSSPAARSASRCAFHSCSSTGNRSTRKSANAAYSSSTARCSGGASASTSSPSRARSPCSWYS